MNDIVKGAVLVVGVGGVGVIAARQLEKGFWKNVSYSLGTPNVTISTNEANEAFVRFTQPMTIKTTLRGRVTVNGYRGIVQYKGITIGNAHATPISVSSDAPATTIIYTDFVPNLGEVLGMSIVDPWEILKIIQSGLTTKGKLALKVGKREIRIPINEKIFFA